MSEEWGEIAAAFAVHVLLTDRDFAAVGRVAVEAARLEAAIDVSTARAS